MAWGSPQRSPCISWSAASTKNSYLRDSEPITNHSESNKLVAACWHFASGARKRNANAQMLLFHNTNRVDWHHKQASKHQNISEHQRLFLMSQPLFRLGSNISYMFQPFFWGPPTALASRCAGWASRSTEVLRAVPDEVHISMGIPKLMSRVHGTIQWTNGLTYWKILEKPAFPNNFPGEIVTSS